MTDKDYKYIIGILVLMIIWVFSLFFGGKGNDVVSYVGFAGTIISIVLSVLAIIYAFYQSTTPNIYAQRLAEASERFQQVMTDFRTAQLQLSAALDTGATMGRTVSRVDSKLSRLAIKLSSSQDRPQSPAPTTQVALKEGLRIASDLGLVVLLCCLNQSERPRNGTFEEILDELNQHLSQTAIYEYAYGFLMGYICFAPLQVEVMPTFKVEIENPNEFKRLLLEEWSRRMRNEEDALILEFLRSAQEGMSRLYGSVGPT